MRQLLELIHSPKQQRRPLHFIFCNYPSSLPLLGASPWQWWCGSTVGVWQPAATSSRSTVLSSSWIKVINHHRATRTECTVQSAKCISWNSKKCPGKLCSGCRMIGCGFENFQKLKSHQLFSVLFSLKFKHSIRLLNKFFLHVSFYPFYLIYQTWARFRSVYSLHN